MARRWFNKNQKRDRKGRWSKGGGAGASKPKLPAKSTSKTAAVAARRQTIQRRRNVAVTTIGAVALAANGRVALKHGAMAGVHASKGSYVMATAHGVSAATSAYRGISFATEIGIRNSKRFTSKQKETFSLRKAAVDKQVRNIERVSNAVLTGGYFLRVAGPVAVSYANSRRSKGPGVGPKVAGFLTQSNPPTASRNNASGLKVKSPRGGVYNLSSFKGKRV